MHTIFTVSFADKLTLGQRIKAFWGIPIIELKYLYPDSTAFCVASLVVRKDITADALNKLLPAAFTKLFGFGVRSVLLPRAIDAQNATDAGLTPYVPDNSLFFHSAPSILPILFNQIKDEFKHEDIWCVFLSDRIGTVFESAVLSNVKNARYITIDCGEFSDILAETLLKQYGISSLGHKDGCCKKVLALFSQISKKRLWELAPDIIIDFFGQDIEYDNALIVRAAEFSLPDKFTARLPDDIDLSAFFSLLFESGAVPLEQFEILRLM